MAKPSRRDEILQALALMLETQHGSRITTAALARQVGVSEAALYRHFPSKAKMLEGLIDFIEEALFPRITRLLAEHSDARIRCREILTLLLLFAERNPGFARLMVGEPLQGENERLHARMRQVFERLQTQLRQIFREWALTQIPAPDMTANAAAALLLAIAEGQISQFVRSEYRDLPSRHWDEQWPALSVAVFGAATG